MGKSSSNDQKMPRFVITLAMLDDDGKVILNKSGGNDSIMEITSKQNFTLLSKVFRKSVQQWYRDENTDEKRKAAWSEEDKKAAQERKEKLDQLKKQQ